MWAALKFALDSLIWELANVEIKVGACMTAQMVGPAPRLRALIALVGFRGGPKELVEELNRFGSEAKRLGTKGSRYSHDSVMMVHGTSVVSKIEVTAGHKIRFKATEADLQKI